MRRGSTFPPLVVLILAALIATTSTSQAIVPEHGPSASGTGTFQLLNALTGQTEFWSFSFDATANKNGQARGRAQFDNLTAQTQVIMRINCLSIDSAFAVMSGRVLHSDDPDRPKGEDAVFAASDGQLLPTPGFDTITPPFIAPTGHDCHDGGPLTILRLESGDIQIQP